MPLESGVVHRQHRAQPAVQRLAGEHGAQVHRRQTGVPVVRVQHLRLRRDLGQYGQRRRAKEGEPQRVVRIVPGVVAVDPRPIEEVGVLDEEDLGPAPAAVLHAVQPCSLRPPAERDGERRPRSFQRRRGLPHLAVQRQHHRRGHAGGGLETRQAAHRLSQPAGARERPVLRRQVDHADALRRRCGRTRRGDGADLGAGPRSRADRLRRSDARELLPSSLTGPVQAVGGSSPGS